MRIEGNNRSFEKKSIKSIQWNYQKVRIFGYFVSYVGVHRHLNTIKENKNRKHEFDKH